MTLRREQRIWLVVGIVAIIVLVVTYVVGISGGITGEVVSGSDRFLTIGVIVPLSGDAASYGTSVQRAVELAKEDSELTNVKVIFEDTGCDAKGAVNGVNKLLTDSVVAIVGELCSGATLAVAPIVESNKIVLVSPASTSPDVTNAGEFVFRTVPSDALQGKFGADLVYDKGYRKLGILFVNDQYGRGFNDVLEETFKGEVVASESFDGGSRDLRTQLFKIKGANAEAMYIISNSPDSAVAALKQAKEIDLGIAVFGSEGLKADDILEAGAGSEGLIVTSVSSGNKDFIDKHRNVYVNAPGPFAAQGYDAFMAIAIAIEQGAWTGTEIKDALKDMEFDGASGKINFDENGDVSGNYEIFEVINGKFVASG